MFYSAYQKGSVQMIKTEQAVDYSDKIAHAINMTSLYYFIFFVGLALFVHFFVEVEGSSKPKKDVK